MKKFFLRLLREEDGPTAVEYAVMLAMILLAVIGSIELVGEETGESFNSSRDTIDEAFTDAGVGSF